ncbi:MAG: YdcF family protein, partial [Cyclobacteriaceae bacterium]|nr:YdcF family protein [Cyclobacteriaceae bacterium]
MFFYFSKIFAFLLMPYTQMCIWFILGMTLKNKKWKRNFLLLGIFYLFFFSNRFIANEAMVMWEIPPAPIENLDTGYQVGIVLGGGMIDSEREPKDRIYLNRAIDRVNHAIFLYKKGMINKILLSGGSGRLLDNDLKEARGLFDYLIFSGVNEADILIEDSSRNTRENALYSKNVLEKNGLAGKKHLVFTSAFHLRRAMLCFRKVNLNVDGFSTDFRGDFKR